MQTPTPRNRHERRKQLAEARRLGRQDLLRQPSATVLRSEMQARVERESLADTVMRWTTIPT